MRFPGAALLLCGLGLLVAASAGAVPKPPPKFWSAARCERVMLTQHASVSQVLCLGSGGPAHCRWTSGHRARLYSEFTVFTRVLRRNRTGEVWVEPGFVRSFTLATRARPGFGPIFHQHGDLPRPADFFMGHVRVLRKSPVSPAQFNSIVAPIAARLMQEETASCTGGSAGAVPKPPPKFWSADRCERVLLGVYAGRGLSTGDGHHFGIGEAICVGSGGPHACRWTTHHGSRLYAEFRVFTRSPLNGGVVRSWTLATRSGHGLVPVARHAGDQYVGWPPDFYMSRVKLLATQANQAHFRSIIAPLAARVAQADNATGCTGGS